MKRELPLLDDSASIRAAMAVIDRFAHGIGIVVDGGGRLQGTITDGDIRRAILLGTSLESTVSELLASRVDSVYAIPVTAPVGSDQAALLALMGEHKVRQIPLLDDHGRVCGLVTVDDLLPGQALPLSAVIMAGGEGKRLRPLTDDKPKPMLPVGEKPILERTIGQLRNAGIRRVCVTTHYKPEVIASHFGDGDSFGVQIEYVSEDQPLGTAGALGSPGVLQETTLVINGDILTRVDFRALVDYHREQESELTVAVRGYDLQIPYGVVECEGPLVRNVREKPLLHMLVNAGIYVLEPCVQSFVPRGERFDMTDLIQRLVDGGRRVVSFPVIEYWLDIGQPADYERAQAEMEESGL